MDARELMIGDWVRYIISKIAVQVESVIEDGINYELSQGDFDFIKEDRIKPIPLTEEILKVNGFSKNFSEMYTKWIVPFEVNIRGNNKYITLDGKYLCNSDYVHELQHALRLCGLNYLADNLKI